MVKKYIIKTFDGPSRYKKKTELIYIFVMIMIRVQINLYQLK